MASFRLSRLAEADLMGIAIYTVETWGEDQAARYLDDIDEICQRLAENTRLGRACDDIRPGLRRMENGRHVIFYRIDDAGVLISRILHAGMVPGPYLQED